MLVFKAASKISAKVVFLVTSFVVILIVQSLFFLIQKENAAKVALSLESLLRKEIEAANPFLIAETIEDLEHLGFLKCSIVRDGSDPNLVIIDLSIRQACNESPIFLRGQAVIERVRAINGKEWLVSFVSVNSNGFYESLWLSRFLALLSLSLGWNAIRIRNARAKRMMEIESRHLRKMAEMAAQVSHDIRSPLVTLAVAVDGATGLNEQSRVMIRNSLNRIRDIVNNLLAGNREGPKSQPTAKEVIGGDSAESMSIEMILAVVDSAVSQMRPQYLDFPKIEIVADLSNTYGLFVEVQATELGRVLSNLIGNAVEALDGSGRVKLEIQSYPNSIELRITDNGKGIPPEILPKLGQRGESHGKAQGHGLGLYHARVTMGSFGGTFGIKSEVGKGTTILLTLPRAEAPRWFLKNIRLDHNTVVVILDDDPTIHEVWEHRLAAFKTASSDQSIFHFTKSSELIEWYRVNFDADRPVLYLCDYELIGETKTGLDIIDMLGVAQESVLVTSHADEIAVREMCEKRRVRLLPKSLAHLVPIEMV